MREIYCPTDKKVIPYGLFDGYSVGDRLLEGVLFRVSFDAEDKTHVIIDTAHADYFEQFNAEMWYKEVREHIDADGDILECPNCHDDAEIRTKKIR
jgi:hypothetical protein